MRKRIFKTECKAQRDKKEKQRQKPKSRFQNRSSTFPSYAHGFPFSAVGQIRFSYQGPLPPFFRPTPTFRLAAPQFRARNNGLCFNCGMPDHFRRKWPGAAVGQRSRNVETEA